MTKLIALLCFAPLIVAQNSQECLTNVEEGRDYFPDKVQPEFSTLWDITYFDTYKVLQDKSNLVSYLLYQCGTTPPSDISPYTGVFEIPVTSFAIRTSPAVAALQELGIKDIDYYFLSQDTISDGCLLENVAQSNTAIVDDMDAQDELSVDNRFVAFVSPFFYIGIPKAMISDFLEPTNEGAYEWVKFYSAFFNLEARANEVFAAAQNAFQCMADSVQRSIDTGSPQNPRVAWITYNSYCQGWTVVDCSTGDSKCAFGEACIVDFVGGDAPRSLTCPGTSIYVMDDQELVQAIGDADIIIYDGQGQNEWEGVYTGSRITLLDTLTAVANQQVYDLQKQGKHAWISQQYSRYYETAHDFCAITGRTSPLSTGGFFRNVFTESIGTTGACQSGDKSALQFQECSNTPSVQITAAPVAAPSAVIPSPESQTSPPINIPADATEGIPSSSPTEVPGFQPFGESSAVLAKAAAIVLPLLVALIL